MKRLLTAVCTAGLLFSSAVAAQAADDTMKMTLKGGDVTIKLRPDLAPKHVERVKALAAKGFYNGIVFHRVIPNFMAQSGDPTGTGRGGSKLPDLPAEFSTTTGFKRGTIGAARTNDPNSANSQFFICHTDQSCKHLNGKYSIWGEVTSGMEIIDAIKGPADKIVKMELVQ